MKAFRLHAWQSEPRFEDVPEPGPGEVLIRIAGAGVCSSDLHLVHDWTPDTSPPVAGARCVVPLGDNDATVAGPLAEVVALAEAGRIKPHVTRFKLDEAPEVMHKLHHGQISGRAVLLPSHTDR